MAKMRTEREDPPTPLAREYARLNSISVDDPALDAFPANRTFRAHELALWSARVGRCRFPLGPDTVRPNPVVVGDLVLVSIFSPGAVVAFDRHTGQRRWRLRLPYYGQGLYHPPGSSLVYGGTCQELLALRPDTGRVVWSFSPYGRQGETIYSSPTVAEGRLFLGDRRGFLHGLDAATGQPLWRVRTSRAAKDDVNSTPVVHGGVVAVGTNARLALGYETASGRPVWRRRLDGPCTRSVPAGGEAALLWTQGSAYVLRITDGALLGRWSRRNHQVTHACGAGELTLLVTARLWGPNRLPWPVSVLRAYRGAQEVYARPYPRWACVSLRYEPATGLVYEATSWGLGILDPTRGERLARLTDFGGTDPLGHCRVHLPSYAQGRLYVLSGGGRVVALRHP
jgi:hypothetical protein